MPTSSQRLTTPAPCWPTRRSSCATTSSSKSGRPTRAPAKRRRYHRCARHDPDSRPGQHAPSLLPNAHAQRARHARRRALPVAGKALSDLGALDARSDPRRKRDRDGGVDALGMHDRERSHLRLAQRRTARRSARSCSGNGDAFSRVTRFDVGRTIARRFAARQLRRRRSCDHARFAARDRAVS